MYELFEIIDLKSHFEYIPQYVSLRNEFQELLLTNSVTESETINWLNTHDVEIRLVIQDSLVLGVVVLYLEKNGEVTFFAREKNKGIGTLLLSLIDEVARLRSIKKLWAWVLEENKIALRVFQKNNYQICGKEKRIYKSIDVVGIRVQKTTES